jgi:hypothetical protein
MEYESLKMMQDHFNTFDLWEQLVTVNCVRMMFIMQPYRLTQEHFLKSENRQKLKDALLEDITRLWGMTQLTVVHVMRMSRDERLATVRIMHHTNVTNLDMMEIVIKNEKRK